MSNSTVGNILKDYFGLASSSKVISELVENEYHTLESWADNAKLLPSTLLDIIEYSINDIAKVSKHTYNHGYTIKELTLADGVSIYI